jgi:hypothetical protein
MCRLSDLRCVPVGIAYRAEPAVGCTFDVWDGEVTADDVREHLVRLAGDRDWPAGHGHLTDLTTLAKAPVPDPEVLDALYEGTSLGNDLKVAVVVPAGFPPDIDLRYTTVTEELVPQSFSELGLACAYLGVDEARVRVILDELRQELRRSASRE